MDSTVCAAPAASVPTVVTGSAATGIGAANGVSGASGAVAGTGATTASGMPLERKRSSHRASRASLHSVSTVNAVSVAVQASGASAAGSSNARVSESVADAPASVAAAPVPAPPQTVDQHEQPPALSRRLSSGGILKTSAAAKHASSDITHMVTKQASEAILRKTVGVSPTASSSRLRDLALASGAAPTNVPPSLAPSYLSSSNTTTPAMQRASTFNASARKSIAVTVPLAPLNTSAPSPKAMSSNASLRHLSTGPGLTIPIASVQPQAFSAHPDSQRMSYHGRSLTMSNSQQLPTPAPNMFYQQQQQLLNPQYRQYTPSSPSVAQSPLYATPQPMAPQQMQQQQAQLPPVVVLPQSPPSPSPLPPVVAASSPAPSSSPPQPSLKLPLSPEITVQYYKDLLSPFELHEVYQYPHIYFAGAMGVDKVGTPRRRTGASGLPKESLTKEDVENVYNNGYDDSRGDYYFTHHDHIGYRYECISILGKGSFGQVAKCFDHKTKSIVALKIIRNKKRFEKQGVVEVKVLDRLRKEDSDNNHHLVHMLDSFYFRGHLCITFELLGTNLYEWVRSGGFRGIHMGVLKVMSVQILQCLQLLYRIKTVHCDLKPENILLMDPNLVQPQKCDLVPSSATGLPRSFIDPEFNQHSPLYKVKVIDFGSSCYEHEKIYTYVQSRFYRSPEVILGISYTVAIDMWSFGCILAEMFTGYPLFPGENEQEQLACIMEVKGVPPEYIIDRGSRRKLFFDNGQPRSFTNSKGRKRRPATKSLSHILRTTDVLFLDFIERCLEWDPERRMKPDEAMRHEWLSGFAPAVPVLTTSPAPTHSGNGRESVGSPQSNSNSAKYSFGDLMSNAASSITRRRELSMSASNSHASSLAAEVKAKKTMSVAVPMTTTLDSNGTSGESSSWKASFSSWRRMGSISGPSSKKSVGAALSTNSSQPDLIKSPSKESSSVSLSPPVTTISGNTITVVGSESALPVAIPVIVGSSPPTSNTTLSSSFGESQVSLLQTQLEKGEYQSPPLTSMPSQYSLSNSSTVVPAAEDGNKTPLENVVIEVIAARSGSTTTATSRKSGDGNVLSRSLSFSKIGGMVRSLSQKKKK